MFKKTLFLNLKKKKRLQSPEPHFPLTPTKAPDVSEFILVSPGQPFLQQRLSYGYWTMPRGEKGSPK